MSTATIINGDARHLPLADGSVHVCICSPPYLGLRDYGTATWVGGSEGCDHIDLATSEAKNRLAQSHSGAIGNRIDRPQSSNIRATVQYRDICGKCGARRVDRQIGLEASPSAYVAEMVRVFGEVKRVLRDDGCLWLNIGDSYAGSWGNQGRKDERGSQRPINGPQFQENHDGRYPDKVSNTGKVPAGLKPKDLIGIPWRLAFALQDDGWWLRDAIIWSKADIDDDDVLEGSAMPGSQRDRCTSAYEFVFQFAKAERYYFDAEAIKSKSGAMPRNVWRINPSPWKGAHFATFPPALVERCVKAGTSEKGCCPKCGGPWERVVDGQKYEPETVDVGARFVDASRGDKVRKLDGKSKEWRDAAGSRQTLGWRQSCPCPAHDPIPATVLDNFAGSGTTGVVATGLGRRFVGVELNRSYCDMAVRRISRPHLTHKTARSEVHPLFAGLES